MNTPTPKHIADAIAILQKASPKDIESLLSDASLAKASEHLGKMESENLRAGETVTDHWGAGQTDRAASREQVNFGKPQAASGAGAERMVAEYASPAPQRHGVASAPEALARDLGMIGRSMKSLIDNQLELINVLKSRDVTAAKTSTKARKSDDGEHEEEEEEDEEEEESEVVEINAAKKSRALFTEARDLLKKSRVLKADAEDMEDEKEAKACKAEARALRKAAARKLAKARTLSFVGAAHAAETRKSILAFIAKADINVVQEEEEEDEEDEEEEAESDKARKAASPDAANSASAAKAQPEAGSTNQADRADAAGNQAGTTAKSGDADLGDRLARIEKALGTVSNATDLAPLRADIQQVMGVLAGKSKFSDAIPDIMKSAAPGPTIHNRIADLRDSDQISDAEEIAAKDIANMLSNRSQFTDARIADRLASTTQNVRAIFTSPLAAAA